MVPSGSLLFAKIENGGKGAFRNWLNTDDSLRLLLQNAAWVK